MSINKLSKKPILLVQLGPINLFWVTAVYYLWELKDKYSFIIFANDDYKKSEKFSNILKHLDIKYIHYQKKEKGFKLASSLLREYEQILKKFKPKKILIYNDNFFDNQCLLHLIKSMNSFSEVYQYQEARESMDIKNDRYLLATAESLVLQERFKFLKNFSKISIKLAILKQNLRYFYYFKIIPFFLLGKVFKPKFNIFTGKYYKNLNSNLNNLIIKYFVYLNIEHKILTKSGVPNCQIISHPLINCKNEVNNIIYGELDQKNQIVIMPSHGFIPGLIAKGNSDDEVSKFISNKYIEFLNKFKKKFPDYSIIFKLHPASKKNVIWMNVINLISEKIKITKIEDDQVNAEKLIIESKIVISDVSTVLWWTIFFDEKIAVSLDIFNFENGDEMLNYLPYVYYINDLNQIEKTNFINSRNLNINHSFSIKEYL